MKDDIQRLQEIATILELQRKFEAERLADVDRQISVVRSQIERLNQNTHRITFNQNSPIHVNQRLDLSMILAARETYELTRKQLAALRRQLDELSGVRTDVTDRFQSLDARCRGLDKVITRRRKLSQLQHDRREHIETLDLMIAGQAFAQVNHKIQEVRA